MSKKLLSVLLPLLAALSVAAPATAREDKPVVWVDRSYSLAGAMIVEVMPVADQTGTGIPPERLAEIQQAIRHVLETSGTWSDASALPPETSALRLQTTLTSLKTGDAAGRWLGFGAGAAKCTIRARLYGLGSERAVADIIITRIVDTGGFFTVGVDTRIHRDLAHDLGEVLVKLLAPGGSNQ